jgi:PAS domain S-box-containing protein
VKGYAPKEVIGCHDSMFYAPEEIEAGDPGRELAEALREGRAEREAWRVGKDGERIWVNEVATAVRDGGGNLVGFTKISRDLTERRELEAERELSRARELTALVEAAERERISRELHDRVATTWASPTNLWSSTPPSARPPPSAPQRSSPLPGRPRGWPSTRSAPSPPSSSAFRTKS